VAREVRSAGSPGNDLAAIRAELKAELESVKAQLQLMTKVFAGCVAIALAVAGYIFFQIVSFAGPISRIPIIEETTKSLEGKANNLQISVAEIKGQLSYVISDLASVKVVVKATDVAPSPITTNGQINEYAFPNWRGVPISKAKSASDLIAKYRPESGSVWIYSTNASFLKSLSAAQPAPSKLELNANAFSGWSGIPITDPLEAAKFIADYDTNLGPLWLFSDKMDFANDLATTQRK
jgi:hypothetical protein